MTEQVVPITDEALLAWLQDFYDTHPWSPGAPVGYYEPVYQAIYDALAPQLSQQQEFWLRQAELSDAHQF